MIIWALSLVFLISIVLGTLRWGISPMPSPRSCIKELKNQQISIPEGVVYDLGSGWGGVTFALKKKFPEHSVIGIEGSSIPYFVSRIKAFLMQKQVKIERGNFFKHSFKNAACIYCYLYPRAMEKLSKKFKEELPKGTLIISSVFALPGWEAMYTFEAKDLLKSKLYIYQV